MLIWKDGVVVPKIKIEPLLEMKENVSKMAIPFWN